MSEKYKYTKRCYLIDHHSPQPPGITLEHLDIAEYKAFFRDAQIDSLMYYCKDHWGVTYYDSKVFGAEKHTGVKGDWIQKVRTLAADENIEFIAYYCIEYDEGAARRFPQWRVRKADGSPLIRDDTYAKWSLCCYQSGYREYALQQLEEIVSAYHPDALFLDIFGSSLCYCDNCRKKFKNLYGYPLPETREELSLHSRDIHSFLNKNAEEFLLELRHRTKTIDPALAITINFSCHYPKNIRDLLDYQFSEPLLKDNWYSAVYARDTAYGQFPILAPGEASQVYNYSSKNQYLSELSAIAAQGCRVGMYSGSQHPDGTLEHLEAKRLGFVYSEHKKMAPFLEKRKQPVPYIGILQSDSSQSILSSDFHADAILRMKKHHPHTQAILGAMELCEHEKLPYQVLPESSVTEENLSNYRLLLLPETLVISESLLSILEAYVANGGSLLVSGNSGLCNSDGSKRSDFSIGNLLGIRYKSLCEHYRANGWSAYLAKASEESFGELLDETTPPVDETFLHIEATTARASFYFQLPSVPCTSQTWVNWWSPPPGSLTSFPAITENQFGSGTVVYFAYHFFSMAVSGNYPYLHSLFHSFCKKLKAEPPIQNVTEIPNILRTAYFQTANGYLVHQLSVLPQVHHGEAPPVSGGILKLSGSVLSAKVLYPTPCTLEICRTDTGCNIPLPSFSVQQIIQIKR